MKHLPGFNFDSKRGVVEVKVIVPGSRSLVRRQATIKAATMQDALVAWKKFRDEVLEEAKSGTPAVKKTLRWYFDHLLGKEDESSALEEGRVLRRAGHEEDPPAIGRHAPGANQRRRGERPRRGDEGGRLRRRNDQRHARHATEVPPRRRRARDHPRVPDQAPPPPAEGPEAPLEFAEERTAFLAVFDDEARFRELSPEGRRFGVGSSSRTAARAAARWRARRRRITSRTSAR